MASGSVFDSIDSSTVTYLIDHIFLPPRIDAASGAHFGASGIDIDGTNSSELNLLSFVHKTVSEFPAGEILARPMAVKQVGHLVKMLGVMEELQALPAGSDMLQLKLATTFAGMEEGDIVVFYVKVQNAAVIFQHHGAMITFSSFEVSLDVAPSPDHRESLMTDRLRCPYPSATVAIPLSIFRLQQFLEQLTKLLTSLSASAGLQEVIRNNVNAQSQADRGRTRRGTRFQSVVPAPNYITEFLTGLLRGIGEGVRLDAHHGGFILKRAAASVLGTGRSSNIWCRSPTWLVIRVTLQICLQHPVPPGADASHRHWDYKLLILYILVKLLEVGLPLDNSKWLGEKLCHMSRKLTYRTAKLEAVANGLTIPTVLLQYVSTTVQRAVGVLEKRFEQARVATVRDLRLEELEIDIDRDTNLTMLKSRSYIEGVLETFQLPPKTTDVDDDAYCLSLGNEPPRIYHDASRFQLIFSNAKNLQVPSDQVPSDQVPPDKVKVKPNFQNANFILLKDIESWVETTLEDYVRANSNSETACCDLYRLLDLYSKAAECAYADDPVDSSLRHLTEIELWISMDKITTAIIPLLKEYPCDVNPDHFTAGKLLLRTKGQLKRLQNVTTYLKTRRAEATRPSIFAGYFKSTCRVRDIINSDIKPYERIVNMASHGQDTFSVRYFDQSPVHQAIYDMIASSGTLDDMQRAWRDRSLRAMIEDIGKSTHSEDIQAKAIIFELDPPLAFEVWRTVTMEYYAELSDFRSTSSVKIGVPQKLQRLINPDTNFDPSVLPIPIPRSYSYLPPRDGILDRHYSALLESSVRLPGQWQVQDSTFRLDDRLRGPCKSTPFNVMPTRGLEAEIANFILEINWDQAKEKYMIWVLSKKELLLRELGNGKWVSATRGWVETMGKTCSFKLPQPLSSLQPWVDSPYYTSNDVISQESGCANWLLHEYYAFAMLRAGVRLQWLNILREIKAGNLPLNQVEVFYLFLQASWQAGPQGAADSHLPEAHKILLNTDFCNYMLDALEGTLTDIKSNWLQMRCMQLVVCLASRVLSLTQDRQIKGRASYFLKACRAACMDWLYSMRQTLHTSVDDVNRKQWQARCMVAAATCRQTFDVDPDLIRTVFNSKRDLGDFIECAAFVYDATLVDNPPETEDCTHDEENSHLLARDARLAHGMERFLRDLVFTNNDWFHYAIARVLPEYVAGGQWEVLDAPADRWITTSTKSATGGVVPLRVHYNLLEGTMLADGIPLGNLPKEYLDHPLYKILFKDKTFFVIKTTMPGMKFQTVYSVSGASGPLVMLYFGMRNGKLIIRAKTGPALHEVIPHDVLDSDLPKGMVKPYIHLLDLEESKLEFRPLQDSEALWDPSNSHWVVTISKRREIAWSAHGQSMDNCDLRLVDYHSPIQAALAHIFKPITEKSHIELTFSPMYKKVYVKLTRYGLEFDFDGTHTKDIQIACRTIPGMVVDLRPRVGQDMQTLYGLKTYLVLREAELPPCDLRRTVIIPHGKVRYVAGEHTTSVWIDTGSTTTIQYHRYSIDTLLGRLVSEGRTQSLLYKAYLHALTSHCLPDPLTGLTGTQQAFEDLHSACVWNFQFHHDEALRNSSEIKVLRLLSRLTPVRYLRGSKADTVVYPEGLSVQRINWNPNLPFFCQHCEFYFITGSILQHWQNSVNAQGQGVHLGHGQWFTGHRRSYDPLWYKNGVLPSIREEGYQAYDYMCANDLLRRSSSQSDMHRGSYVGNDIVYTGGGFRGASFEEQVCRISRITQQWLAKLKPTPMLQKIISEWKDLGGAADKTISGYHDSLHRASLVEYWCPLYEFCRSCSEENDKYRLLFILSAFAYSAGNVMTVPELRSLTDFEIAAREIAQEAHELQSKIEQLKQKWGESGPGVDELLQRVGQLEQGAHRLQMKSKQQIRVKQKERTMALLETLVAIATNPGFPAIPPTFDFMQSSGFVNHHSESKAWIQHTKAVQFKLNVIRHKTNLGLPKLLPSFRTVKLDVYGLSRAHGYQLQSRQTVELKTSVKSLQFLLYTNPPPTVQQDEKNRTERAIHIGSTRDPESNCALAALVPLKELLARFSKSATGFHQCYSKDLETSWEALYAQEVSVLNKPPFALPAIHDMESHMHNSSIHMRDLLDRIVAALTSRSNALTIIDQLFYKVGFQPQISVRSILSQLRGSNANSLKKVPGWKEILVSFGRSVTLYQRATRMYRAVRQANLLRFTKELENTGHIGWDPLEFPEWLLFEIENNLLIRPIQAATAKEMITSQRNAVMQLNMGEGKSSVIIPIVAAALADRRTFVRIVVLKPLWKQMYDLLSQKLSGLLHRRIYHVSFSRANAISDLVQDVFEDCMEQGGIFLTAPEHLLSYKLKVAEMLCERHMPWEMMKMVHKALKTQQWLDRHVRDIFDESDELLHVRYEMVYTMGSPQPLELGTQRWAIIQEILSLVRKHTRLLMKKYPLGIELIERQESESFPLTRLLAEDAEVMVMGEVASELITTSLQDWIPEKNMSGELLQRVLDYVIDKDAKEETLMDLKISIPQPIMLLKGLIGHGIIAFVFREKRWRVDYGLQLADQLDQGNSGFAVPYRAKDTPVPRAQFAHPDIRIALTCLCYYYQGLTESQLKFCFQRLHGLIDPDSEYHSWIQKCTTNLPPPLRHLGGVNLDNAREWHTLYHLLKMTKRVIDFYLSHVVFPSGCQEFPAKLSTSAWDLAEERNFPTTGFSGTNDTRYLLPLSIEQRDLPTQVLTNAKVLSNLLRPENRFYRCIQTADGKRLPEREILHEMVNLQHHSMGQIQVLIDVGAQVLDMDNKEVARYWLEAAVKRDSKWTATLFFDQDGELTVIGKEGRTQPYRSSVYVDNMMSCLVYLDEAHTRGTDINLPSNSVAAVTLGTKLTKDKLAQACMRMRKLGYGHSVCFFAPPEVDRQIRYHKQTHHDSNQDTNIETTDILYWVMHESVIQTQQNFALWASQGIDYQRRRMMGPWTAQFNCNEFTAAWKKSDSKTLTEMYSAGNKDSTSLRCMIDQKMKWNMRSETKNNLLVIRGRCEQRQIMTISGLTLQELQEREFIRETIQEHRENRPSPRIGPHTHQLHPSLAKLIDTGELPSDAGIWGSGFCSILDSLRKTTFRNQIEENLWGANILTTTDFALTAQSLRNHWYPMPVPNLNTDLYLRPVTWILSTGAVGDESLTLIILSPFEVNELLPQILESKFVNLHMYSPKIKRLTPDFYDLTSLAIPAIKDRSKWQDKYSKNKEMIIQINLYAGELFCGSHEMYRKTSEFLSMWGLGAYTGQVKLQRKELRWKFLKHLVEARVNGMRIDDTDMGFLLRGRVLEEKDWENRLGNSWDEELNDGDDAGDEARLGRRNVLGPEVSNDLAVNGRVAP